jgi:hypothetical protein
MHQADRSADGVGEINGAAIGDINAEANTALICDQAIATVETFAVCGHLIDKADALSMHLLRGNERRKAESMLPSNFPVNGVQSSEHFFLVVRHLDIGDPPCETVHDVW